MRIGELSRAVGVDVETIRYYEKAGLMPGPARQSNGYRAYGRDHLERLAFIRHCRALDMPLADIKRLLGFLGNPGDECCNVDRIIDAQLERITVRLASLTALERQLKALRQQCGEPQTTESCGILHELVAAAQGEACVCHLAEPATGVRRKAPSAVG